MEYPHVTAEQHPVICRIELNAGTSENYPVRWKYNHKSVSYHEEALRITEQFNDLSDELEI